MFLEQQIMIIMISEGSRDTKDWSNDTENSTDHRNILHFTIYSNIKQLFILNYNVFFCCFFYNFTSFTVYLIK